MKNTKKLFFGFLIIFLVTSCENFLDELPDNRTELDNNTKIRKILVSAYPSTSYAFLTEVSSDNVDDYGLTNPNTTRMLDQIGYWVDVTESDNDEPIDVWESCYSAIAHANQALSAIEELGSPSNLQAEKGEALIARAYGHFTLVNVFAKHFNTQTSSSDLGVPYLKSPETTLNPSYERLSVEEVYNNINDDIEAGLPLINDDIYEVKSYHFNKKASYAFAARFNLYYEKWQKAKDYADLALGTSTSIIRDWSFLGNLPRSPEPVTNGYIDQTSNFLVQAHGSNIGLIFGAYFFGSRFSHTRKIADEQTLFAPTPWSGGATISGATMNFRPFVYTASNLDKTLSYKIPYRFEFTDPVARIGFRRTILVPFNADETLLVRAEAKIMLGENQQGLDDLNTWSNNFYIPNTTVSITDVDNFYNSINYSTSNSVTQKKKLSPKFSISPGIQENLLHYVLQCRRILTVHEGLRWFDVKRYGIEIPRLQNQINGVYVEQDLLTADDPRKAIQIPQDVVAAGLTANPR